MNCRQPVRVRITCQLAICFGLDHQCEKRLRLALDEMVLGTVILWLVKADSSCFLLWSKFSAIAESQHWLRHLWNWVKNRMGKSVNVTGTSYPVNKPITKEWPKKANISNWFWSNKPPFSLELTGTEARKLEMKSIDESKSNEHFFAWFAFHDCFKLRYRKCGPSPK